jgi:hypothetical protein
MKKALLVFVLLSFVSLAVFAQDTDSQENRFRRFNLYADAGMLISSWGTGNGVIINAGFEFMALRFLGFFAEINVWIMFDTFIGAEVGTLLHPFYDFTIDPFLGIAAVDGYFIGLGRQAIDIAALLGTNVMFSRVFGFRFTGKLYLLSLAEGVLIEATAGFVFRF